MNFFEKEMRQMFDDNDIFHDAKFVGKTMLAKLDEDLRIKLQFIASHISGQYDTVQMTIINRTDGMVDKQNFKFSDIIGKCIRPGREPLDYHMWEYNNKPEWYTPISLTDKARIADTVMDYAEMYTVAYCGYAIGDGDACKFRTKRKCTFSYRGYAIFNNNVFYRASSAVPRSR